MTRRMHRDRDRVEELGHYRGRRVKPWWKRLQPEDQKHPWRNLAAVMLLLFVLTTIGYLAILDYTFTHAVEAAALLSGLIGISQTISTWSKLRKARKAGRPH